MKKNHTSNVRGQGKCSTKERRDTSQFPLADQHLSVKEKREDNWEEKKTTARNKGEKTTAVNGRGKRNHWGLRAFGR